MSVKTPSKHITKTSLSSIHPLSYRRDRLLPAAALAAAVLAGLLLYGLPLWQCLCWALAFGGLLPLGLHLGDRAAARCRWAALLLGPLLAFVLVEQMNYNYLVWEELSALQITLNLVWYYMAAGLLYLVTGRVRLTAGLTTGLFVFVGLANRYIIHFRGRTIFPGDLLSLQTAANVAGNYDYTPDAVQLHCLLALALFLLLLWKVPKRPGRQRPHWQAALPVAALCAAYLAVFFQTDFLRQVEIEPSLWTTRGNGFVLNFSVCLRYSSVEEPEDYSQETLAAIQLETEKDWTADPDAAGAERPVNLIVIMNESFSDLAEVFDLETNEDPLPFFHSLTENTIRGTAYSSVFGGTTANSEYEFLTGNTMAFLPEGTVPFHMYVGADEPNLGGQLKSLGYHTVFMHPYLASGWNRRAVYQSFGFDEIHFQGDFQDPTYMRNYITDQADYENLVRRYEEKEAGTKAISALLCAKEDQVAQAVEHLKEEQAALKQRQVALQRKLLRYLAQEILPEQPVTAVFPEDLEGDAPRELMNLVVERGANVCAVFVKTREGFRYVIGSREEDVRPLCRQLNEKFAGRGGGKPEMVQGSLTAGDKEEICAFCRDYTGA